jgi:hypothetical protein
MADNPFDQFDAPKPTSQSSANPFDKFDVSTSSTTETSKDPIDLAISKSGAFPFIAGGVTELGKGIASGVELVAPETGKALYDPINKVQQRIQEANPVATTAGKYGSYILPFAGLTKGFQAGRTALGLGEASTLGKVGEAAVKGGTIGGVTTPTEEGREKSAAIGAVIGPVAEVAIPAAVGKVKELLGALESSKGKMADSLYQSLKTQLNEQIENLLGSTSKDAQVAKRESERIGKAQEQLGGRDKVATQRQQAREKRVSQSLDDLSKDANVLLEDVGDVIQKTGRKNIDKLRIEREKDAIDELKDPLFIDARAREKKNEFISNNPQSSQQFAEVVNEIKTQIERTPEPYKSELKRRFDSIVGQVKMVKQSTEGMSIKERLFNKPTAEIQAMTMDQAEFLRRMLNNRKAFEVEGFPALDVTRQNILAEKLSSAMNAFDNRFGDYLKAYKNKSVPIEKAIAGRGKSLTDVELQEAENVLFSSDRTAAANYYLNGTAERAERLLDLVGGKNTEVINSVKGYFRNQLESMNSQQASQFIAKNEGLLRVFPELQKPLNYIAMAKKEAETMGVKATQQATSAQTRLAGEAGKAQRTEKELSDLTRKYETYLNQVNTGTENARSVVNNMFKTDRIIDAKTHADLLTQIKQIEASTQDAARAKQLIDRLLRNTLVYGGLGTMGTATYFGAKALGER